MIDSEPLNYSKNNAHSSSRRYRINGLSSIIPYLTNNKHYICYSNYSSLWTLDIKIEYLHKEIQQINK